MTSRSFSDLNVPWVYAIVAFSPQDFEAVIMTGQNVNESGESAFGLTALHRLSNWTYSVHHLEACEKAKLLLQHGANVFARNDLGQTPIDICMMYRPEMWNRGLIDILEQAMAQQSRNSSESSEKNASSLP